MAYNLGTAEGRIVIDGSGAEKGFSVAQAAASGFAAAINAKMDQVRNLGERLVGLGAAGTAGFGLAVKAASGFENEMDAIQAVSGATADQMGKLSDKALQLGKDTTFSASEAAQAMGELVKAGVPLEDILNGAADATVNLAAAGGVSLPEAANIASAAMNQFSLAGADLPRVADLIAGAANASAIDVHDFGASLSQAGGVANLAGLDFDDLAVAIAEMGKQGYVGSDAGTSLKTMFLNLQPTMKNQITEFEKLGLIQFDATKAMQAMVEQGIKPVGSSMYEVRQAVSDYLEATQGIPDDTVEMGKAVDDWMRTFGAMQNQFYDAEGNLKSLSEVQEILQNSTENLTAQQKTASLELLFGTDAIRAAAVMAKNGAEGFDELSSAMGNVDAADVAKTRMDNLSGSIEQFKGALETAQIIIGQVILPVVRAFVDALTFLVNIFNNLPEPIQKLIGGIAAVATVFSLVSGAALILLTMLPAMLGKFLLFRTIGAATASIRAFWIAMRAGQGIGVAVTAMTGPWIKLGNTVKWLGSLAKVIRIFWIALTGPIGLIVLGIAALVAAFIWCWNNIDGFKEGVMKILHTLGDFFVGMWEEMVNAAKAVGNFFTGPFLDFFKNVWDWLKKWGTTILMVMMPFIGIPLWIIQHWDDIIDFFKDLPGKIVGFLSNLGQWIGDIFSKAWNWITSSLATAWDATMSFLASLPEKLAYGLGWLIGSVARLAVEAWQSISTAAVDAWNATIDWLQALPGRIADFFVGLATGIAEWAVSAWESVTTSAADAWNGLIDWLQALPARIGQWFVNLGTSILNWAVSAWKNLTEGAKSGGTSLITWLQELPGKIGEWFVNLGTSILNWAVNAWNSMTTGISQAWDATWAFITGLPGKIGEFFANAGEWLLEAGGNLIQGFWDGIVNVWNAFWDWVGGIIDFFIQGFKDAFGISSPSTVFLEIGQWILQGLWDGIVNIWNSFIGWWQALPGNMLSFFQDAGNWLIDKGMALLQGFWNGVVSIWNGFWNFVSSLPGTIKNLFSAAGSWLLDAGRWLVEGLWNGIKGAAGWLWDQVSGWVGGIVDNVLGFFGISSPSKVFAGIGGYLAQGLAQGIAADGDLAVNEAMRLATAIGNAFADTIQSMAPRINAALGDVVRWDDAWAGTEMEDWWNSLLAAGWKGDPTDGMEALYRPAGAVDYGNVGMAPGSGVYGNPGRVPASQEVQDYASTQNTFVSNVYNPVAEKASDSEARRIRAVSAIGAFAT